MGKNITVKDINKKLVCLRGENRSCKTVIPHKKILVHLLQAPFQISHHYSFAFVHNFPPTPPHPAMPYSCSFPNTAKQPFLVASCSVRSNTFIVDVGKICKYLVRLYFEDLHPHLYHFYCLPTCPYLWLHSQCCLPQQTFLFQLNCLPC